MSGYARLAVGSWGSHPDVGPVCWGLAAAFQQQGRQVRHFYSRACYCSPQGTLAATGRTSGYLDPWLSSTDDCRRRLSEAYRTADLVLAEGCFRRSTDPADSVVSASCCGDLDTLANRIDLPRVIVLDAAQAADCRIPKRPASVDGVFLDGITGTEQFVRLQTCIEGAWSVPVVGGLQRDEGLRQRIACLAPGRPVPIDVIEAIVAGMLPHVQFDLLLKLAYRTAHPQPTAHDEPAIPADFAPTIAVAFDEAFGGYFADVLEMFEAHGAKVVDFSPLADEALPDGVDVVLFGCGNVAEHAGRLSENHCMLNALQSFARRGGRIYAEGGGTAYLARTLTLDDGATLPMVDALPLAAHVLREPARPEPVQFTFDRNGWLADEGTTCRAYRGGRFAFTPLKSCLLCNRLPDDLFASENVVGGRLQLHLAAHPNLFRKVFERRTPTTARLADVG